MRQQVTIRPFESKDWPAVSNIYYQGLQTGNATFETEVPEFATWDEKYHKHLRWVGLIGHEVVGWTALLPVSTRKVYAGVAEVSIYVHDAQQGKGIGSTLMKHLIAESEAAGIWTLYASIFPENVASVKLHAAHGFREIGYREKIAQRNGKWRNTVLLERRSKIIGV